MDQRSERDKIKVLVVDDNIAARQGLKVILELEDDIAVVGLAGNGLNAVEEGSRLQPDVVLMDYLMPGMDGLKAANILGDKVPGIRVVMLSVLNTADSPVKEWKGSAVVADWLSKTVVSAPDIVNAVRRAAESKRLRKGGEQA